MLFRMKKKEFAISEALRERNKAIGLFLGKSKYRAGRHNQTSVEELEQIIGNQNNLMRKKAGYDTEKMNKDGVLSEFIYRDASTPDSVKNEEAAMKELASNYSQFDMDFIIAGQTTPKQFGVSDLKTKLMKD